MANRYGSRRMSTPRRMVGRTNTGRNNNPITRTFNAPQSPKYYRPDGQVIPTGAPLHQHQDGTVMTEHTMSPNDNAVVVSTNRSNGRMRTKMQQGGRVRTRMQRGRRVNENMRTRSSRRPMRRTRYQSGGTVGRSTNNGRHIISQGTHRYSCPGTTITHECTRIKKDNQGRI